MASGLEKRAMLPVMLAVEIRDQSIRRKPIARGRLTIGAKRKVGGEKQQCYEQDWLWGFHTYFPSQGFHARAVMLPEIKNCVRSFFVLSSCNSVDRPFDIASKVPERKVGDSFSQILKVNEAATF